MQSTDNRAVDPHVLMCDMHTVLMCDMHTVLMCDMHTVLLTLAISASSFSDHYKALEAQGEGALGSASDLLHETRVYR